MTVSDKKRILIVDDDPHITDMLGIMLELHGYQVQKAHGTAQGMAAVAADPPDAIVVDMMMPHVSGIELCRYIRRDPATANLPVIFFSARANENHIQQAMLAGATAYLKKTVSREEILRVVDSALLIS